MIFSLFKLLYLLDFFDMSFILIHFSSSFLNYPCKILRVFNYSWESELHFLQFIYFTFFPLMTFFFNFLSWICGFFLGWCILLSFSFDFRDVFLKNCSFRIFFRYYLLRVLLLTSFFLLNESDLHFFLCFFILFLLLWKDVTFLCFVLLTY